MTLSIERRGGTSRLGVSLETHVKPEVKTKLWVVENPQNISSKSMRAHGSKFGVKNETPKSPETRESRWEDRDFLSPKIRFSSLKIWFSSTAFRFPRNPRKSSSTAFRFLQRLSALFDAFLISVTAFKFSIFLNGFPIFLNGFPLSEKSGKIYLRRQIYERSLSELRISRSKLRKSR